MERRREINSPGRELLWSPSTRGTTVLFGLFAFASGLVIGLEELDQPTIGPLYEELSAIALAMLAAIWVSGYRRTFGGPRVFDEGLYCFILGVAMVPIYLLAARGRSGILPGLAFLVYWAACGVFGLGVYVLYLELR